MRRALASAALAVLVLPAAAAAQLFPTRSGESGILDVPDAEVSGPRGGQIAAEYGYDHASGYPDDFGPWPISAVAGTTRNLDVGFTMRQLGQPQDPRPARLVFGAALKLQLWAPEGPLPGLAVSGVFDRVNDGALVGGRLALSTGRRFPVRVAGFVGGEAVADGFGSAGLTYGVAATAAVHRRLELAAELLGGPRGQNIGGALRYYATPTLGFAVGGNYFPGDDAYRVTFTISVAPPAPKRAAPASGEEATPTAPAVAAGAKFLDDRPHFRLRMAARGPDQLGQPGRVQYGPYTARVAAAGPVRPVEPGAASAAKAAAPTLEDLAEAQLRDQETLAATRERRVRATAEELGAREKTRAAEAATLADAEKALAAREQQLDARQRVIVVRGAPTQQQRQLESLEAQLASEMQKLSALERSYIPALDASQGREKDAAAREKAERDESLRLATAATSAPSRAAQLELRKQALGAKNRELAALEARLIAIGERLDALERQLRLRQQRLDAWGRRLDARTERLDALEQASAPKPPPPSAPKPTDAAAPAPKDKASFVMVVKSPTAIMKEKAAGPAQGPATPVHAGAAVEKAVAAATVVTFPTPATQLTELDRETLVNMAKLAARDHCELLIWARAKDPGLMTEAQRRATEIQTLVMSAAKLDPNQVVTRITMRPGAQGVDVVVSALRETAKTAASAAPAPAAPALLTAESGKRQIREAVQTAQSSIEVCVGEHLRKRRMQRAEGVLKLTVSPQGRVARIGTGGGDLAGDELETCLQGASARWQFPTADAEYVVDVPITVMSGGGGR